LCFCMEAPPHGMTSRRPDAATSGSKACTRPWTPPPGGRLVFHVFAALAEFIRELIVEGPREGLDAARSAACAWGGRRP
jgi:hypothetical protein